MTQISLGGYPAKQCARITHNRYSPSSPPATPVSAELQLLFDEGLVFETAVVDELAGQHEGSADLLVLDEGDDWDGCKRLTVQAMEAGVPMIAGGRLPDVNGRVGAPDLLVRHESGYLPVDIKNHRTLSASKNPNSPRTRMRVTASALAAPDARSVYPGYSNNGGHSRDDTMQLAHYTRMLQELGFHCVAGSEETLLIGGIIGTSDFTALTGDGLGIVWYDLNEASEETFSASEPKNRRKRSPLARYDHEFGFRMKVAETALARGEIVRPFRTADCDTCEWFEYCSEICGPEDASFTLPTGHLNVREWLYLYPENDRLSVDQLAEIDVDATLPGFRIHSVGTTNPENRLRNAVRRARMTVDGIDIEPRGEWPAVPSADIEVDFDIEWDTEGRIYQWGLRIRVGQDEHSARYEPVFSFEPLDEPAEEVLAEVFAARINELKEQARQSGRSFLVFHWADPEVTRTRKFAAVAAALEGVTCDLYKWFGANFFARQSSSIKSVAPLFGFKWRVDEAGGLISKEKIRLARGDGPHAEAARQWCLDYNESDVAAQAAIRDGLRRSG